MLMAIQRALSASPIPDAWLMAMADDDEAGRALIENHKAAHAASRQQEGP